MPRTLTPTHAEEHHDQPAATGRVPAVLAALGTVLLGGLLTTLGLCNLGEQPAATFVLVFAGVAIVLGTARLIRLAVVARRA